MESSSKNMTKIEGAHKRKWEGIKMLRKKLHMQMEIKIILLSKKNKTTSLSTEAEIKAKKSPSAGHSDAITDPSSTLIPFLSLIFCSWRNGKEKLALWNTQITQRIFWAGRTHKDPGILLPSERPMQGWNLRPWQYQHRALTNTQLQDRMNLKSQCWTRQDKWKHCY